MRSLNRLIFFCVICRACLALNAKPIEPPTALKNQLREAAHHFLLDPALVEAVIKVESNYNKKAKSKKGAMGLMQVMPKVADEYGIRDPYHGLNNLMGACEYLRKLINRYRNDLPLALAAYNAGPMAVDKYGAIPPYPETKKYVKDVLKYYEQLKKSQKAP